MESVLANEAESGLLRNILGAIGQHKTRLNADQELTLFKAVQGRLYQGELMVVGRALNGGGASFRPVDCSDKEKIDAVLEQLEKDWAPDPDCPMAWVSSSWSVKREAGYATGRSAFWRCCKAVALGIGIAEPGWASHLLWSNLYKVAPALGGNPSSALCSVIQSDSVSLHDTETKLRRPVRILYSTGLDWAKPFLKSKDLRYVGAKHVKAVQRASNQVRVIATHPQGKNEAHWVKEVLDAFAGKV